MEHRIVPGAIHHAWDNSLAPVLRIQSGDSVRFALEMSGRGQVRENDTFDQTSFDFDTIYNLAGPIWIEGAEPGDTLRIDVLSLEFGEWGWCAVLPELGLLPEEFPSPFLKTFSLRDRKHAVLAPGVRIRLVPFLGTMGTHPDQPAKASPFPPHKGGGNIDTRHLTSGTSLWLPVWCKGGLFSCGDPHGAQGDGEVCVAAIECDMEAVLRFTVEKRSITGPRFFVPSVRREGDGPYQATMGLDSDLMMGAKEAVRSMIDWLVQERGLPREEAYMLCSLAGDLRIFEIVDAGVWNVGFTLPMNVFDA